MTMRESNGAPELLEDVAGKAAALATSLLAAGHDVAKAFGAELAQLLANDWGGQQIYFPKGTFLQAEKLHRDVWDAYNGNNINELVKRFGISRVWVYKIVARQRAAEIASRQGKLPGM